MSNKAVISLTIGLEDSEKVTVAFLVSVGAAEKGRPALMFLNKVAVPLAVLGFAHALACDACSTLTDLMGRYGQAGGPASWYARSASTHARSTGQPRVER
jgi:predicted peroxiredoxin